jgi:GNAT superfamily N-acetyltransferase
VLDGAECDYEMTDIQARIPRPLTVRAARAADRDFVLATARRLADFGPPPWRTVDEVVLREQRALSEFFDHPEPGSALYIATRGDEALGFILLKTKTDYFTGENVGHVDIVAVDEGGEGQGVGGLLMREAEQWGRKLGYRRLTLNVFDRNDRARRIYEHLAWRPETLHYIKVL